MHLTKILCLALFIASACTNIAVSDIDSTVVPLQTPQTYSQQALEYRYFEATIPTPASADVLLITVSSDIQDYIGIFVSTSDSPDYDSSQWPDWDTATEQCFYSSIDTCALNLPDIEESLTVHFSVVVGDNCNYTLEVRISNIYDIKVNRRYGVNLDNRQSGILRLQGDQFWPEGADVEELQQVVIVCEYVSFETLGHFELVAAVDELPNPSQMLTIRSESLNAFSKLLILDPLDIQNSSYYILLQGQNGTHFNFSVLGIASLDNPKIAINTSMSYISTTNTTYTYNGPFQQPTEEQPDQNPSFLPLSIDMYAYRGIGRFRINYCNDMYMVSFQNNNGENGEVIITPEMRLQCYQNVTRNGGGLLIQNLEIAITDVDWEFGYTVILYEGDYDLKMYPGLKQFGTVGGVQDDNQRIYSLGTYGDGTNFTINLRTIKGSLTFSLLQCISVSAFDSNCTTLQTKSLTDSEPMSTIKFSNNQQYKYNIEIVPTNGSLSSVCQFSLMLTFSDEYSFELNLNSPIDDIVEENQYNFYYINVSKLRLDPSNQFSNATLVTIKNTVVNGDVVMLASTNITQPTLLDLFNMKSDISISWDGSITFVAGQDQPENIYISVFGDTESIYHIQFNLNTSANIPARYLSISDDAQNDFVLTPETPYILIKYSSHIIPYSITFSPTPDCIIYGSQLPLPGQCSTDIPHLFTDDVIYLNISQNFASGVGEFKFSVYANSGNYLLSQDRPLLVACEKQCYEIVVVIVNGTQANIVHSGAGRIVLLPGDEQVSNDVLGLQCAMSPCSFQINASMSFSGVMEVAYESDIASRIGWRSKPMVIPAPQQSKNFYARIDPYDNMNSFIFYTAAVDLTIYYNIISLDQLVKNSVNYTYPTPNNFTGVSYGDPLSNIHIVDIGQENIQAYDCDEPHVICIVTLSVYVNTSIEYSNEYISNGVGYYSANTYSYLIESNEPILLRQAYSVSYFTHLITGQEFGRPPFTIHVKPISNCRPIVQTEATWFDVDYYMDVTLPEVMPGQSTISYRLLSDTNCLVYTGITQLPYRVFFKNMKYELHADSNGEITVIYTHEAIGDGFFVQAAEQVSEIIVSFLAYDDTTGMAIAPSQANSIAYAKNVSQVSVPSFNDSAYEKTFLITIKSEKPIIQAGVRIPGQPITLLHNQQHDYQYDPSDNSIDSQNNDTSEYLYHSTSNFLLFIQVNRIRVRVTVRDDDIWWDDEASILLNTVITNSSEPWLVINNDNGPGKMGNYRITCQFSGQLQSGTTATLKLHIEEDGINGLPVLYGGVSLYDAFVHNHAMNCYQFTTPMLLGDDKFSVDFVVPGGKISEETITVAIMLEGSTMAIHQKSQQISESVLRTVTDFYGDQLYRVCFTINSGLLVGVQYSVVVNLPNIPMVYPNETPDSPSTITYSQAYQIFEYINYDEDSSIAITLTNCLGRANLISSSSYQDMKGGKMTEITELWSSNGITTGMAHAPHGYYYIGVSDATQGRVNNIYKVEVAEAATIDGGPVILHSLFGINWGIQAKAYPTWKGDTEYVGLDIPTVIQLPSIKDKISAEVTVEKVVYSMYLMNLQAEWVKNLTYNIDTYSRCPYLLKGLQPVSIYNVSNFSQNPSTITFEIAMDKFKPQSNISIRAEVLVRTGDPSPNGTLHTISYYYGSDQIYIKTSNSSNGLLTPLKWFLIVITVFGGAGVLAFVVRWCMRRRRSRIDFEMTQFQHAERQMETRATRKPINANTGYGQFVDESLG